MREHASEPDAHEALRELAGIDAEIDRQTKAREILDGLIFELRGRREAANGIVYRAARQAGLEANAIIRGPLDSLWVLRDGQVVQVKATSSLLLCPEPERTPAGLPVIPAEYNPTPEVAETVRPEKAAYRQVITSGTSS